MKTIENFTRKASSNHDILILSNGVELAEMISEQNVAFYKDLEQQIEFEDFEEVENHYDLKESLIIKEYEVGDRIKAKGHIHSEGGTITEIKGKKIFALMDRTTAGVISVFSLRNDNRFIQVGWSKEDAAWGGYFYNLGRKI